MTNTFISCLLVVFYALCTNGYYKKCNNGNKCPYTTIDCIDNEDCSIDCTGYQSCHFSTINCPKNGNCNIQCTTTESCKGITINGNTNAPMNIYCSQLNACNSANIDGRYASELKLLNCADGYYTCLDITIWCPQNINGQKRCTIQGDNSVGGDIYAVNSWNDIQFETPNKWGYFGGNMYCTQGILSGDYSNSCVIPENGPWECSKSDSICQNPPTPSPTESIIYTTTTTSLLTTLPLTTTTITPTPSPTEPITSTNSPTFNPVTTTPSVTPTQTQSEIPTVSPTEIPTISPTTMSTNRPTNRPSDDMISIEVTHKKTTEAVIDGKVNETPETISHSTTNIIVTDIIVPKENAIVSAVDSYGIYIIMGILLFFVGCCCLSVVIYKGRYNTYNNNKTCDSDHGIEMGTIHKLKLKPRTRSLSEIKTIKASPLGVALTTNELDLIEDEPSVSAQQNTNLQYSRKKRHHRLSSNSIVNFYPHQFSVVPTLTLTASIPTSVPISVPSINAVNGVNYVGNDMYNYTMYKHDEIEGEDETINIEISDDDNKVISTETPLNCDMDDDASSLANGNVWNNIGSNYDDIDVDYINVNMDEKDDDDSIVGAMDENEGNK